MAPSIPVSAPPEKAVAMPAARNGISSGPIIMVMLPIVALYFSLALFSERLSYGSDRDDFLIAISALRLSHHGSWEPSRMPGFPVFERMVSLVVAPKDARRAKTTVAFCSLATIGLILVLGILSGNNGGLTLLIAVLFSLVPLWLQTSFMVMDYGVAMLFVIAAGVLLEFCPSMKSPSAFAVSIAAGILLAFGIGSRLTTAAFLPAAVIAVVFDRHTSAAMKVAVISGFTVSAFAGALLFFKPAFDRYGIDFLSSTHMHIPLANTLKLLVFRLIGLGGGMIGCGAILVLVVIAIRNMKARLFERLWIQRGWGIRALFLFAFFNTLCYALNPDKESYFLPLLIGLMLLLIVGLEARDRSVLTGAILVMAIGSFVQLYPRGFHGMEVQRGQVLNEWRRQRTDRPLFAAFQSLIKEPHKETMLIGYPATDRMVVWFYDSTKVVEVLPHPCGRTLWGASTFYPDQVYEINGMLLADPPLLLSDRTSARLKTIIASRGISDIRLVRSWINEPIEGAAALCQGKNCTVLSY